MKNRNEKKGIGTRTIEVPAVIDSFETARNFIADRLVRNRISKEIISETMLIFESLFQKIIEQGFDEKTRLTIVTKRKFGEIAIKIGFEGKAFAQSSEDPTLCSSEDLILNAYSDKIDYSYHSGFNNIRITVKRNYHHLFLFSLAGFALGVLISIPLHYGLSADTLIDLEDYLFYPLVQVFAKAMLMIGTPVTFFSLLKNLTETYIISERNSAARRLQFKTIVTSGILVILAFFVSLIVAVIFNRHEGYLAGLGGFDESVTIGTFISELVPDSIIKPFEALMPFPLMIVALLIIYALRSAGKYFDSLKKGIDVCYMLFSKMLHVVMFTLPFFSCISVIYLLILTSPEELLLILKLVLAGIASLSVLVIFYLVRLKIGRVKVRPFVKKLGPLIRENFQIGSVIDAVPFNVRYCSRNYGMDRESITEKLSVLAQISLDGNCYIIMLTSMMFIFLLGESANWLNIVVVAILVVFLSLGAPNQPGSILIGMLIITLYLHADYMIVIAIYAEVFFGIFQNLFNALGDIVTIAIEEGVREC